MREISCMTPEMPSNFSDGETDQERVAVMDILAIVN